MTHQPTPRESALHADLIAAKLLDALREMRALGLTPAEQRLLVVEAQEELYATETGGETQRMIAAARRVQNINLVSSAVMRLRRGVSRPHFEGEITTGGTVAGVRSRDD